MEHNRCLCLTNWVKLDQMASADSRAKKAIYVSVKENYNPSLIKKFKAKINNGNTQTQTYNNLSPNSKRLPFLVILLLTLRKILSSKAQVIREIGIFAP